MTVGFEELGMELLGVDEDGSEELGFELLGFDEDGFELLGSEVGKELLGSDVGTLEGKTVPVHVRPSPYPIDTIPRLHVQV